MPSRNLLLLLVIFMAQHQDMGVSSPIHSHHPRNCHWNVFTNLTQELYTQSLKIYNATKPTDDTVLDNVPRIECQHHCGPKHLISNPKTCLQRIADVLTYYYEIINSTLPNNSQQNEDFTKVKGIIANILHQLKACDYKATNVTKHTDVTEKFLRMNIGSPLLSSSILIARVFSPGNPENHTRH